MWRMLAMLACGAVLSMGLDAVMAPADAKRGLRGHGSHVKVNKAARHRVGHRHLHHALRPARHKYVYRNGRRGYWRNGIWILAPLAAGAAYAASCSYEYNRWQATGSSYWRDRYYACAS